MCVCGFVVYMCDVWVCVFCVCVCMGLSDVCVDCLCVFVCFLVCSG